MRILLLNDYSGLHATLAKGLKELGHDVTVVSGGNGWRNYPRDISVVRGSSSHWDGIRYLLKVWRLLPRLKGYDIVQLINPIFFDLRPERLFPIYRFLRRHNKKMVLGAFGEDSYWARTCVEKKPLRYSDHNIGEQVRTDPASTRLMDEWIGTSHERLNQMIANDCDGIVACLYEYWVVYQPLFPRKTTFIPLPIERAERQNTDRSTKGIEREEKEEGEKRKEKTRIFIGIDAKRSDYKGTDIMLKAAEDVQRRHPDKMELVKVVSVPFAEYQRLMEGSDAILDQLYSYTPSMNSLLAMSKGIIDIGGGEPENYEIIHEEELRPIINVETTYESVYHELEQLVMHPERIPELRRQSIEYVRKHHDYLKIAQQYIDFYQTL
jgi:glycosyltransferase involved in cell wall biosynthesis